MDKLPNQGQGVGEVRQQAKFTKEDWRRASRHIQQENKRHTATLVNVPRDQWPQYLPAPPNCLAVWRSNRFLVQVYDTGNDCLRLSVCRLVLLETGHFMGGITWEELQEIKSQVGLGNCDAVEVYPKYGDEVNVANMRHLWVFTNGQLDDAWFIWRDSQVAQAE